MKKKDGIIIVRIHEGLGNQLFQYAFARSWKNRGVDVQLDMNKTYDHVFHHFKYDTPRHNCIQNFNITLPSINVESYEKYDYIKQDTIKNKMIFYLANHNLWKYRFYDESAKNVNKRNPLLCLEGNYYLRVWVQDERYFKNIRNTLIHELTPKKKIVLSENLSQALENNESVSLHVRRGDYVRGRHTLKVSYFEKAIETIKIHYKNPLFLIFSEDIEWVKKHIHLDNHCIFVNEDRKLKDYEELIVMSQCKSNIIANSTFSWWGAWLNNNPEKIVIAPKYPWLTKQENIIPKEWIAL